MLKTLINTLAVALEGDGLSTNELISQGFEYLIKDTQIYGWYQLRFEINRANFESYFRSMIDSSLFRNEEELKSFLEIAKKWYIHLLDNKSLVGSTSSLKSDAKKWYKEYKDQTLKNFDRFFESVLKVYNEAFNVYDVIFYDAEAIWYNKEFSDDRGSCYINSRQDYYNVISQMNSFYVMIYRNNKPITRFWAVLSPDKEHILIFNSYGYKFKDPMKLFLGREFYTLIDRTEVEDTLGIYVNSGEWFIDDGASINDFCYKITCPFCGNLTYSDSLKWSNDRLHCDECDGRVYSSYYDRYIEEEYAVYSNILETYLYEDDAVYSHFYDDYIPYDQARKVYNIDEGGKDYVLEDDSVYSNIYECYIIYDQAVYSSWYNTYLLKDDENIVYSEWHQSWILANDDYFKYVNGDFIHIDDLEEYFIKFRGFYYEKKKLDNIIKFNITLKPLKGFKVLKASY
jgi:hypothetical protein